MQRYSLGIAQNGTPPSVHIERATEQTQLRTRHFAWIGTRACSFGQSQGADSSLELGRNQLLCGMGLPFLILELIPRTSLSFR